jgi:hypothetical protein
VIVPAACREARCASQNNACHLIARVLACQPTDDFEAAPAA